jgi:HSP20 family protein
MKDIERVKSFTTRILNLEITPHSHAWHPPTDLFENESGFVIRVEIAGMYENDFAIHCDRNMLLVLGKRQIFDSNCAYHRMEIAYGEFSARVSLPDDANISLATAEYENGFLTINVPRSKPVNINISSKQKES